MRYTHKASASFQFADALWDTSELANVCAASSSARQRVLDELDRRGGYLRQRDLLAERIDPHILSELVAEGRLARVRRGLYRRADAWSEHLSLADAAAAAPTAVICLLSALDYYALTTVTPWEVYLAIPRKARPPRLDYPPVRVVRYSDRMFGYGITEQPLADGRTVRMYGREKTIADAFRFDHLVGRDVALEALKTYLRQPGRDVDGLLAAAAVCRVRSQVAAALEALL